MLELLKQLRSTKLGLPDEQNNTELGQLRTRLLKQLRSRKLGLPDREKNTELGQQEAGY